MGENIKKPTAKYGLTEQQSINKWNFLIPKKD